MYEPAVGGDNLRSGNQAKEAATHHCCTLPGLGHHTHRLGLVRIQTSVPSEAVELRPGELSADRRPGFVYSGAARLLTTSVCPDLESILLGCERGGGGGRVAGGDLLMAGSERGSVAAWVCKKEEREDQSADVAKANTSVFSLLGPRARRSHASFVLFSLFCDFHPTSHLRRLLRLPWSWRPA